MEAKHTKGPWAYQHRHVYKPNWSTAPNSAGEPVIIDHAIADVDAGPTDAQARANARLIAAAPELLAACKAALTFWGMLPGSAEIGENNKVGDILTAAIEKAQGR